MRRKFRGLACFGSFFFHQIACMDSIIYTQAAYLRIFYMLYTRISPTILHTFDSIRFRFRSTINDQAKPHCDINLRVLQAFQVTRRCCRTQTRMYAHTSHDRTPFTLPSPLWCIIPDLRDTGTHAQPRIVTPRVLHPLLYGRLH